MDNVVMEVNNLTVKYDERVIIDDLSFSINDNITFFLCPNNSCKTTLIKALSGIIYSNSGKIFVNNIILSKKNFDKYIVCLSTILDDINNQFLFSKVFDEIKYPLINLEYNDYDINSIIEDISNSLKINTILGKDVLRLSYIEKIKVLLATSIVHSPKILLIDDIFRFLNKKEKKEIMKLLKIINTKYGVSLLITTSDINDVIEQDNIFVLKDGKVVMNDSFSNIIKNDNELTKMGFEIPIMVDLSRKLQFYNLIDNIYYDEDKVVDKLWN